jgi:hypothetical protein
MRERLWYGALAVAFLVAGCDSADPPTGPAVLASVNAHARRSPAVTGGGAYDLALAGPNLGLAKFDYDVLGSPDGAASGSFRQSRKVDGYLVDFTGEATCVAIDPVNHRAWVGGVITRNRSTHPNFQDPALFSRGKDIWFRTVDYGAGHDSPPDRSTTFGFIGSAGIGTSAEYCAARIWAPEDARTWPVVRGNIRVHTPS